jgi:hypothetical protein
MSVTSIDMAQSINSRRRAAETGAADQEIFIETEEFASAATRIGNFDVLRRGQNIGLW